MPSWPYLNDNKSLWSFIAIDLLAWVVRKVDHAIHRIKYNPADSVVCFVNSYLMGSDLSGGERYPAYR